MAKKRVRKGLRLHIGIFGRRNVGKSSLLNAITRQNVSIVSDYAGTTTDPVEKPMELLPLGPVLFIDTAGVDDTGALGEMRIAKTRKAIDRTDLAVIVTGAGVWGEFEEKLLEEFKLRDTLTMIVINKCDEVQPDASYIDTLEGKASKVVAVSALEKKGALDFRQAMLDVVPQEMLKTPDLLGDLVNPGDLAILVTPIDKEAPKGRLILPQQQAIRNLLDNDAFCIVVKERELRAAFDKLKDKPKLVVTDSQAFLKVAADTPHDVPMTSFSILFARMQGDLAEMVKGALAIDNLEAGDKILIAESCSHHPIGEDIGRVKIPRWLTQYVGGKLEIDVVQGHDFPDNLSDYKLVIHCGACMWNRKAMLNRILHCKNAGVPITNYGLTIAFSLGIFDRALEPFAAVHEIYKNRRLY